MYRCTGKIFFDHRMEKSSITITFLAQAAPDVRIGGGQQRQAPKIRIKFANQGVWGHTPRGNFFLIVQNAANWAIFPFLSGLWGGHGPPPLEPPMVTSQLNYQIIAIVVPVLYMTPVARPTCHMRPPSSFFLPVFSSRYQIVDRPPLVRPTCHK